MEKLLTRKTIDWHNILAVGIIGFILGVIVGFIFFSPNMVFGQTDAVGEASIGAGVGISVNAGANNSELINNYVENVKSNICPTLDNQTAEQECMNL